MLEIISISSSSKGNCYALKCGADTLLIEAGVKLAEVRRKIHSVAGVDGCLVTHGHGDHAKNIKDMINACVDVYCSKETAEASGVQSYLLHHIKAKQQFRIKNWTIMPFDTQHDCPGSLGFLIEHKAGHRVLFATDTAYLKYRFKGLTHLMIEANFSREIVERNLAAGTIERFKVERLLETHFSIERVKDFLQKNDLSRLVGIWLLHLSRDNSNAEQFQADIQKLTGIPTYVCGE